MATLGTFVTGQVLTAAELNAIGTWTAFTPAWTNFTPGAAVQDFAYTIVNKIMIIRGNVQLSGSTMGTNPFFTVPASKTVAGSSWAIGRWLDSGTQNYFGVVNAAGTSVGIYNIDVGGVQATLGLITATSPFTWVNNDGISFTISFAIV